MIPKHTLQTIKWINKLNGTHTPKEKGFLISIERQAKDDIRLSDKQAKWLNDIYVKYAGGGDHQQREII